MPFPANIMTPLSHAWKKLAQPYRHYQWRQKTAPFWHKGEKGLQFELYPGEVVDYYIYAHGLFEKRSLYLIEALLPARRTVMDVGANIGNHALFYSTIFDKVHAFEPHPGIVKRLTAHKEKNNADNITIHTIGLSDVEAALPFLENTSGNSGAGGFVSSQAEATCTLNVRTGDQVVTEHSIDNIDLIKFDVEGHELQAMKGLQETIKRWRPVICFEHAAQDYEPGYFDNFKAALVGYDFYECLLRLPGATTADEAKNFLARGGLPWLRPLGEITPRHYDNIIAIPHGFDKSKLEKFLIAQ